ncbi:helix-turn-helix domain-containing protein [Streptomyces varsoviensis]|uniref:helix-turn-helix domain-containing protein n=1 Tax=Streptomyces varsoviensis TaxID=67373 RepID=UPI000ADCF954
MPPRSNPTARQARLGADLRKMREAAALLGSGQTQISHIEAGRFGVSEERLRRLAAFYACDDRQLVDALVAMGNERRGGWWEEYRGILAPKALDLAELEHHAIGLRTMEIAHIPRLLQTEEHV